MRPIAFWPNKIRLEVSGLNDTVNEQSAHNTAGQVGSCLESVAWIVMDPGAIKRPRSLTPTSSKGGVGTFLMLLLACCGTRSTDMIVCASDDTVIRSQRTARRRQRRRRIETVDRAPILQRSMNRPRRHKRSSDITKSTYGRGIIAGTSGSCI
jgi:hypothetical protein